MRKRTVCVFPLKHLLATILTTVAVTIVLVEYCSQYVHIKTSFLSYDRFVLLDRLNSSSLMLGFKHSNKELGESCNEHTGSILNKTCSGCFRPKVYSIADVITEILPQESLNDDQPLDFFKESSEILYSLSTNYLLTPDITCPFLLILQMSVINRKMERDVVRTTWGSVSKLQTFPHRKINADVKVIFVVGKLGEIVDNSEDAAEELAKDQTQETLENDIRKEATSHGDILYLDMTDSYNNLTLKLLIAFKWVKDNCPCVNFVLKVDYDTFVNVPLLVDTLLYSENRFEFSIVGHVYIKPSPVNRVGRWKVDKELYPMSWYPLYASGCGYVIAYTALVRIVEAAQHVPILPIEDAYITGVLRNVVGCKLLFIPHLFTNFKEDNWDLCSMFSDNKILGTNMNETRHREMWKIFVNNGSVCIE